MNIQAEELNNTIKKTSEAVYSLLSKRGKEIFFPKKGILSQTTEAKGKKIDATIGIAIEDDGTPMRLKSIAGQININPSLAFPYAPSFGTNLLREKWKSMLYLKNPSLLGKEISLPLVTSALTHGLSMIGYMFVDPVDAIIMPDLYWENYDLVFCNAYDAQLDLFPFFHNNCFNINSLKEKLLSPKSRKKILLLNFPNNPSGYTPTRTEVRNIISAVYESAQKGNELLIIIDDAYFGLVFENEVEEESLFAYLADTHENVLTVKIDGATKEDYIWGFRVGFITFNIKNGTKEFYTALENKTAGAVRGNISNASHLSQSLVFDAFNSSTYMQEKKEKYNILKSRYDSVKEILTQRKEYEEYFTPLPFNSGYFMCIRLNGDLDGEKVRQLLLNKYDTGIICSEKILRIAYSAVAEKDIPILFENIYSACREMRTNRG